MNPQFAPQDNPLTTLLKQNFGVQDFRLGVTIGEIEWNKEACLISTCTVDQIGSLLAPKRCKQAVFFYARGTSSHLDLWVTCPTLSGIDFINLNSREIRSVARKNASSAEIALPLADLTIVGDLFLVVGTQPSKAPSREGSLTELVTKTLRGHEFFKRASLPYDIKQIAAFQEFLKSNIELTRANLAEWLRESISAITSARQVRATQAALVKLYQDWVTNLAGKGIEPSPVRDFKTLMRRYTQPPRGVDFRQLPFTVEHTTSSAFQFVRFFPKRLCHCARVRSDPQLPCPESTIYFYLNPLPEHRAQVLLRLIDSMKTANHSIDFKIGLHLQLGRGDERIDGLVLYSNSFNAPKDFQFINVFAKEHAALFRTTIAHAAPLTNLIAIAEAPTPKQVLSLKLKDSPEPSFTERHAALLIAIWTTTAKILVQRNISCIGHTNLTHQEIFVGKLGANLRGKGRGDEQIQATLQEVRAADFDDNLIAARGDFRISEPHAGSLSADGARRSCG
jgi:hypothetical protein